MIVILSARLSLVEVFRPGGSPLDSRASRTVPRGPGGSQGGQRSLGPPPPYSFSPPTQPSALDPSLMNVRPIRPSLFHLSFSFPLPSRFFFLSSSLKMLFICSRVSPQRDFWCHLPAEGIKKLEKAFALHRDCFSCELVFGSTGSNLTGLMFVSEVE